MAISLDQFTKKLAASFGAKPPPKPPTYTNLSLGVFKAKVADFARPNRFTTNIYVPPALLEFFNIDDTEFITWTLQTAQLPSRGQGDVGIKYHGMELKLVGDYIKTNLTLTFLNDYGFIGRNLFEKWMEIGSQKVTGDNSKTQSVDALLGSIFVNQIGRIDAPIKTYIFRDVVPVNISSIELDQTTSDSVEKFTVEFSYSYYEYPTGNEEE